MARDKNGYFESMPKELRETAQKIIPVELNSQHNNNATKSTVNPKKRPEPLLDEWTNVRTGKKDIHRRNDEKAQIHSGLSLT
jgi:hypothetical protein